MWTNPELSTDLTTFTREHFNEKENKKNRLQTFVPNMLAKLMKTVPSYKISLKTFLEILPNVSNPPSRNLLV